MTLDAAAIARLCAWLQAAELPPAPLDTLPGVQACDVELLRRQVLHSVQVGDGDYRVRAPETALPRRAPSHAGAAAMYFATVSPLCRRDGYGSAGAGGGDLR